MAEVEQPKRYRVDISVYLTDQMQGGRLEVRESIDVSASNFLEMAKILGAFHDLATKIKEEHER